MSDTTKTEIETLQEQINQLKEQDKKRTPISPSMCENFRQIKSSRVRAWGAVVGHIILPPVASAVYCAKTEKWAPFLIGTGVAVVGAPLALIDMGITMGFVAPVTSAVMIVNQVKDDRRRQGFIGPEEADVEYFSRSF